MLDADVLLVAEADDRLRDFLASQLSADGAIVYTAADAAQTRARAAAHAPDLLLLGRLDDRPAAMTLLRAIRARDGLHGQPARDLRWWRCSTTSTTSRCCVPSTPAPTT